MGMGGDGDMHGLLFCFLVDCIVFRGIGVMTERSVYWRACINLSTSGA